MANALELTTRPGADFCVESSTDGAAWQQMRITHLHGCPDEMEVGVYACSPVGAGFRCRVLALTLGANAWHAASA